MSSFEQDHGGGKVDRGEKISSELVVTRGDASEMLDNTKESLDEVAFAVERVVTISLDDAVGLGRYDRNDVTLGEDVDQSVGIISLVREERLRIDLIEQWLCLAEIGRLSSGQREADGVAQRVDDGMDFRRQSASGASDGLVFTVFFRAPALC